MPIYEYICRKCKKQSEILVFSGDVISCPVCNCEQMDRIASVFSFVGNNPHTGEKSSSSNGCSSCASGNCSSCHR